MTFRLLHQLPEELLASVLAQLVQRDLCSLNLASKWCYGAATPYIWGEVELVDCKTLHESDGMYDDHDDTPLIKKLIIFATNPFIASCVQVLTHRCHLPPPAIFTELPYTHLNSQTLSIDPRTIRLVQLAARQMHNVRTLRIIFGHPGLTDALLRCFFDASRSTSSLGCQRIRRLWLENCRISAGLNDTLEDHPYGLPLKLDFSGLHSVRLRRLPMRPGIPFSESSGSARWVYSRVGSRSERHDGVGGWFVTSTDFSDTEHRVGENDILWSATSQHGNISPLESFYEPVFRFDDLIFEALQSAMDCKLEEVLALGTMSRRQRAVQAYRGNWLDPSGMSTTIVDPIWKQIQREKIPSADAALSMFRATSATLTSLNLDWVQTLPPQLAWSHDAQDCDQWTMIFIDLFRCRFSHLRAFQLRNTVVRETTLPPDFYLLGRCRHNHANVPRTVRIDSTGEDIPTELAPLHFLEAHSQIQCLAWPMDGFFPPNRSCADATIQSRVDAVIDHLGRTLTDLRVDTIYSGSDELLSEELDCPNIEMRASRRRFITDLASRMSRLTSIKIEGGLPRDERREIIRALHACPLEKIVMIGVSSPLGNTWGSNGVALHQSTGLEELLNEGMEGEEETSVHAYGPQKPSPPPPEFAFSPQWEWHSQPPMLWTLASYHSSTVRELKFCGYKGAAILFTPTPITAPLLTPLRHFHQLRSFIMSFWLPTAFESADRDLEIVQFWLNARSPTSTALVALADDDEPEDWERELRTRFSPPALAWHVTNFLGPYLSETAKARGGGVHVRASFYLGDAKDGIFDLDLHIGKGSVGSDVCKRFEGPREELEPGRRRAKLDGRRWF